MRALLLSLLILPASVLAHNVEKGDLQIRHPWSRATPPGAKVGVGYMELRNRGSQPDRLLGASTPLAKRVEMHVTRREGDVVRMRQVESFDIPAGERVELGPGGGHLMLVDLARPLKKGERVPLT
ncbi:MAG: copper chaperone PCu(A)C, partial [Pseudomonadota bacterium]|nr:copper chaperone PCu(A)C [Pseudomonadota bacterium]